MKRLLFVIVLAVLAALPQPASAQRWERFLARASYPYDWWDGGYGLGGYGLGRVYQSGLKFDLGRLPKAEKRLVEQAIVKVDEYPFGEVGRYDGRLNSMLRLDPGAYNVSIVLPDGRQWGDRYLVRFGEATPVYPPQPKYFHNGSVESVQVVEQSAVKLPAPQPIATQQTQPPAQVAPAPAAPPPPVAAPQSAPPVSAPIQTAQAGSWGRFLNQWK